MKDTVCNKSTQNTNFKQVCATLLLSALCLQSFAVGISAQSRKSINPEIESQITDLPNFDINDESERQNEKIAPDLIESVKEVESFSKQDEMQKVIIQLTPTTQLNEMLSDNISESERREIFAKDVKANKAGATEVREKLRGLNGLFKKSFNRLGLVSAELPLSQIRELLKSAEIAYISPDREVQSLGHVGGTVGLYNTGIGDRGDSDPNTWLAGSGLSIAVIDSGADTNHDLLEYGTGNSKVTAFDFTGAGATDNFGHGTHVISTMAGDWRLGNAAYEGFAGGASILSLKALGNDGRGITANVIAAIDWSIANKSARNIRVINLSLGMPPKDSYVNDPLCQAARRAVNAGIVVVASAGNFGKDSQGRKLYGSINSPGIEPSVITVGAANTFGTDFRSDDTIATFSSRGPTRGYVTVNGVRKYDNLIKPDLVAPGNRIIGARSSSNVIAVVAPSLAIGTYSAANQRIMYMSGTSMAAPVVAGAAALLIDTNPTLTPNLVKAILMYSAQPLNNFNTLEQGAGMVNLDGAVRLARLVKSNPASLANGAAMLKSSLPASQSSVINGQTVNWGKGIITNFGFLSGNDLMTKYQGMYGNGMLMGDGTPFANNTLARSTTKTSGTLSLYSGAIKNNGLLMGDGVLFLNGTVLGNGLVMGDGIIMGDGMLMGDGLLMGDNLWTNLSVTFIAGQSVLGDNTSAMLPQ